MSSNASPTWSINMYMGTLVDEKKVDESAHKRANDRIKPEPVMVHYHKHAEPCELNKSETTQKHKYFGVKERTADGEA